MTSFSSPNSRVPALSIYGHVAVARHGYYFFQLPQHVRAHMWSPVEAYPIVADRELKSLTANPFFNTAKYTLFVSPVHASRNALFVDHHRNANDSSCLHIATRSHHAPPLGPEAKALCTYNFTIWSRVSTAPSLSSNYYSGMS